MIRTYPPMPVFVDYRELDKKLRKEAAIILRDRLAKFVGRENTPELRKEIVEDLLDFSGKTKR
jgi:hypothetical protein